MNGNGTPMLPKPPTPQEAMNNIDSGVHQVNNEILPPFLARPVNGVLGGLRRLLP